MNDREWMENKIEAERIEKAEEQIKRALKITKEAAEEAELKNEAAGEAKGKDEALVAGKAAVLAVNKARIALDKIIRLTQKLRTHISEDKKTELEECLKIAKAAYEKAKKSTKAAFKKVEGKRLRDIVALIRKDPPKGPCRLTKRYMKEHYKVDRGGIIQVLNPLTRQIEYYATVKEDEPSERAGKTELLGEPGSFGKVKKIQNMETGEIMALKVLMNPKDETHQNLFIHEGRFLEYSGYGFSTVIPKKDVEPAQGHERPCLVMKFAPGKDLDKVLKNEELSLEERIHIFLEVLKEVKHLHELGLIHNDIKPRNIKYDKETGKVSLVDLGLMMKLEEKEENILSAKAIGTKDYMALEVLEKGIYSRKSDIYALGCTGRAIFQSLLKGDSDGMEDLEFVISSMNETQADERMGIDQAIADLKKFQEKINPRKEGVSSSPSLLSSASSTQNHPNSVIALNGENNKERSFLVRNPANKYCLNPNQDKRSAAESDQKQERHEEKKSQNKF